jgi:hypothetical protein
MILIDEAIYKLYPNAVTCIGGKKAFDKDGNEITLDFNLINPEFARIQAEHDAKEYQRKRAAEYPSIVDQLDTLYHGGYDAWKATIQAVKEKYPKEQS